MQETIIAKQNIRSDKKSQNPYFEKNGILIFNKIWNWKNQPQNWCGSL